MTSETVVDALSVSEETILEACGEPDFPEMEVIEQVWETDPIPPSDVRPSASDALHSLSLDTVPAGGEVALGVRSREIANLSAIVAGVVEAISSAGYDPFVFPAMGSHGGRRLTVSVKCSTSLA